MIGHQDERDLSNNDILLNGSDYWGLDDSIRNSFPNTDTFKRNGDIRHDPLDTSTMASTDWQTKTIKKKVELDEFEKLEQQAQDLFDYEDDNALKLRTPTTGSQNPTRSILGGEDNSKRNARASNNAERYSKSSEDRGSNIKYNSNDLMDDIYDSDSDHDDNMSKNINDIYETVTSFLGNSYNDQQDDVIFESEVNNRFDNIYDSFNRESNLSNTQTNPLRGSDRMSNNFSKTTPNEQFSKDPLILNNRGSPSSTDASRSGVRESQRWGAVTRPGYTNDPVKKNDDDTETSKPKQSTYRDTEKSQRYLSSDSEESKSSDRYQRPFNGFAKTDSHVQSSQQTADNMAASSTRASRPSLSSRTILRPNSASRAILKPKSLQENQQGSARSTTQSTTSRDSISTANISDSTNASLAAKAKELEEELETYRYQD